MQFTLNKKIIAILVVLILISFSVKTVFAVWSGTFYDPGETLNPECLPSQTDCDVLPPVNSVFAGDHGSGSTKGLVPATVSGDATKFLRGDATWQTISGGGNALTSSSLAQFASTTSLELKGVISDETGSGALVFATSPTLVTPVLGAATATSLVVPTLTTASGAMTVTPAAGSNFNLNLSTTGDFAVNTSQLYVDTSAANVGIGTTAPTAKLSIVGTGNNFASTFSYLQEIKSADSGGKGLWFGYDTSSDVSYIGNTINSGTLTDLGFVTWNGATWGERMRLTSTGKLGIATTGPDAPLDVLSASTAQLRLTSADGTVYSELYADSSGDLTVTATGKDVRLTDGNLFVCSGGSCSSTATGQGNLVIETGINFDSGAVLNFAAGDVTLTHSTDKLTLLGGSLTLGENSAIALDPAGSADGKYTGTTVTATAGYSQTYGDIVYLDPTDSRWEAVDANSATDADGDPTGIIGIVVVAGTDGNPCTILLSGIIRADAKFPTFTINNPIYVSETAAAVTQTQPTTTDVVIRVVGFPITADEMYFNPSSDYITHI